MTAGRDSWDRGLWGRLHSRGRPLLHSRVHWSDDKQGPKCICRGSSSACVHLHQGAHMGHKRGCSRLHKVGLRGGDAMGLSSIHRRSHSSGSDAGSQHLRRRPLIDDRRWGLRWLHSDPHRSGAWGVGSSSRHHIWHLNNLCDALRPATHISMSALWACNSTQFLQSVMTVYLGNRRHNRIPCLLWASLCHQGKFQVCNILLGNL